jgi:dihydrolipoamide dehydrogenase
MRGAILVDDRYHTGVGEIYAIGDAIGGDLLAHKAMAEGIAAAEWAAGRVGQVNYAAIAAVVYTDPEIAAVGLTEAQVREEGRAVRVGKFPFAASGRARAAGETHGLVKVVADAEGGRLLGLHILGPRASELIAEAGLAIEFEASAEDVAIAAHAHPTLSEALKEAALAAIGRAIHV